MVHYAFRPDSYQRLIHCAAGCLPCVMPLMPCRVYFKQPNRSIVISTGQFLRPRMVYLVLGFMASDTASAASGIEPSILISNDRPGRHPEPETSKNASQPRCLLSKDIINYAVLLPQVCLHSDVIQGVNLQDHSLLGADPRTNSYSRGLGLSVGHKNRLSQYIVRSLLLYTELSLPTPCP